MKFSLRNFLTALPLLALGGFLQAQDVILRLEADSDAPPFARLNAADPAINNAAPVLDAAKADAGWRWTEYRADLKGYVATGSLSKSLEVDRGARILAAPDRDAPLLTHAEAGDQFSLLSTDDQWAAVRFKKEVPVYFNLQSLSGSLPTAAPTPAKKVAPAPEAPEPAPRSTALRRSQSFDPNTPPARLNPQELPPENVAWSGAADAVGSVLAPASGSIVVPPAETAAPETPRAPQIGAGTPTRAYVGQLVREISSSGPRYPLRLHVSGRRVAYIDMSQIFISDLRPYLNRNVYIRGEVMPVVPGSRELIIVARVIRLAD